jgi:hypothetical protein
MKAEPIILDQPLSDQLAGMLADRGFKTLLQIVSAKMDTALLEAADDLHNSSEFPSRKADSEKKFSQAARYKTFLEVAREIIKEAGENKPFTLIAIKPTE